MRIKGPWYYVSGAVWASLEDAERPDGVPIAQRGRQRNSGLPEPFAATDKDDTLRAIAELPRLIVALKLIERFTAGRPDLKSLQITAANALKGID